MKARVDKLLVDNINRVLEANDADLRAALRSEFTGASTVQEGGSPVLLSNAYGSIAFDSTSTGNAAGVETDLRSVTLPARALGTNGDGVHVSVGGTFATGTVADVTVYFGGIAVFTGTAVVALSPGTWSIQTSCWRASATEVKCLTTYADDDGAFFSVGARPIYASVSGLVLSDAQVFKITANDPIANNVTAEIGSFAWTSAP